MQKNAEPELLLFENYSHSSSPLSAISEKQVCLYSWDRMINHNEKEGEYEK